MTTRSIPLNLSLYNPGAALMRRVGRIFSADVYDGSTKNFHPGGLFSNLVFGVQGSQVRKKRFGAIDMKLAVFHPVIYDALVSMKEFHAEIMSGKSFAIFDKDLGEFIKSDPLTGKTGYSFFLKHWRDLKFERRESNQRQVSIDLIEKYKNECLVQHLIVLPAALRDLEVDETGRATSDEINNLYYTCITTSNGIMDNFAMTDQTIYDRQRWRLQNAFNQIYDTLFNILQGKKGLFNGKLTSRAIHDATRTVISAQPSRVTDLNKDNNPGLNHVSVGLFQSMKSLRLPCRYFLRNGFLRSVFGQDYAPATLTDKKTLKSVSAEIARDVFDLWNTDEGIEKLIDSYEDPDVRHDKIEVSDYYLGLLYRGPDNTFRVIHGIDELPDDKNASDCTPLTWTTFFYTQLYGVIERYPMTTTRYPIEGIGSAFPAMVFLETTVTYDERTELGPDWQPMKTMVAKRFPHENESFYNSYSPHPARLANMGGDHDGDQITSIGIITKEGIEEVLTKMRQAQHYKGTDGNLRFSLDTDTALFVYKALTAMPSENAKLATLIS